MPWLPRRDLVAIRLASLGAYPFLRAMTLCPAPAGVPVSALGAGSLRPSGGYCVAASAVPVSASSARSRFVDMSAECGSRQALPSTESNVKKNPGVPVSACQKASGKATSAAGRTCFCVRRCTARVSPAGRPYPFLRRPRAALDFVRRSRAYPILRGARGRVVSGMACRARPGVLAVGRIGGREQERGAWPAIGAGGSGAGRGVMKVAQVAPPVALPASENKKPRHRANAVQLRSFLRNRTV
ncbi:hypothetical protein CNE_2c24900 [Cupriavidus necator N-1]|uniref:Uncharacterized protein n=1 Tax=Cupriavidus necator (strain ATCC 43291 / DSM 13513 / CCUG 52238 / LMG 8453 / N-1) TaxID=1042878 RepID=F8GMT8_CUPNN|nr:hypothetical protein CNE_2c24900 [Cupriavidus necator N-1]